MWKMQKRNREKKKKTSCECRVLEVAWSFQCRVVLLEREDFGDFLSRERPVSSELVMSAVLCWRRRYRWALAVGIWGWERIKAMVACRLGRETLRFDFEKRKSKVVFGLELREKRWSHGGAGVLWWWREKQRERKRWTFWFCKKRKNKRGRVFEFFRITFVFLI